MQKRNVLVVDDQLMNRVILHTMLEKEYNVFEAENGEEAIKILHGPVEIHAIMLDIVMPVMNGYQFMEYLNTKENRKYASVPVIVMTGNGDTESEEKALTCGGWDFVAKPYQPRIILTRLKNAIARSEMSLYEKMRYMANHDTLTGLYNRAKMFKETAKMLAAHPETEFVFFRVDVERFHLFNSAYGEQEGDKLLVFITKKLGETAAAYPYATYCRMESDVFCICVPYDMEKNKKHIQMAADLLRSYRKDYVLKLVFGGYIVDDSSVSVEEMYSRAALGSKKCKNNYESNLAFYDNAEGKRIEEELEIVNEMQQALDEEQYKIYFQPKYELMNNTASGAEALVRWLHPQKGLISPGKFIPIFEKNGFIAKLDYYVWEHVCMVIHTWLDQGKHLFPISVNISRVSLNNPNLVEILKNLITKYEIPVELFQVEITETVYMSDPELMKSTIFNIRKAGFVVLMDDFGSGYSSLNTLKDIEVDILKVDMKFLPVGDHVQKSEIILASIIRMASWIGMAVVVEGVETEAQKELLEGIGCDYIQGYYYARPMPQDEYERDYVNQDISELLAQQEAKKNADPESDATILVIDDDVISREVLKEYFKEKFKVQLCENAEKGMAYLKRNAKKVCLILLDHYMTGFSGFDFLEYFRNDPRIAPIPKIVITSDGHPEDQVKAFRLGAYDFITKPFVKEIVIARVGHVLDISNQMEAVVNIGEAYRLQADLDKMTGLYNKSTCQKMGQEILTMQPDISHALFIIDIDHFKQINDNFGHLSGDNVIKCVAHELKSAFRKTDVVGRFGGDEYMVMMNGMAKYESVKVKASDLEKNIIFACAQQLHINVSVSIGIAFSECEDKFDDLFARADHALYEAKKNGRGRSIIYGESVPPICDDDKPIVLICGEDPLLYPSIALAYGTGAAFANITSFEELKAAFEKYRDRIHTICIDTKKRGVEDANAFYEYIQSQGGGSRIPILAVCQEGNMEDIRSALKLQINDIFTLPPHIDSVRRKISKAIMMCEAGTER